MTVDAGPLLVAAQYLDSAYPAGGFAHSRGLETAVADGMVATVEELARLCRAVLLPQVARTDAVAAAACVPAVSADDLPSLISIDRLLSATKAAREAREASTRMGRRLLETAAAAERDGRLAALLAAVREGRTPGNHACVLGAVLGRAGLAPVDAAAAALWSAANGWMSAGLRLMRITHEDVQHALAALRPECVPLARRAAGTEPEEMAAGSPLAEIWAMRHEVSSVRLFAS